MSLSQSKALELREKETKLFHDLQGILDGAEGRSLTTEEAQQVENLNGQVDAIQTDIRDASAREAAEMRLSSAAGGWTGSGLSFTTSEDAKPAQDLRGFMRGDHGRELRIMPEHRAQPITATETKSVPEDMYSQFTAIMDRLSPVRTVSTIDTFSSSDIRYAAQSSQVSVSSTTAEGASFTDFEPTFRNPAVSVAKYTAQTQVTTEAINDSLFSIEQIVMNQQAESLASAQNKDFLLGTSNSGSGLFEDQSSNGGVLKTATSSTTLTIAEMVAGLAELASTGYFGRSGAFIVSPGLIDDLLNETADSRPILQPQAQSTFSIQSPFQIFGRPVYVSSEGNAMSTGNIVACYIASDCFHVADVEGLTFLRDPYSKAAEGEVNLLTSIRSSGVMVEPRGHVAYKLG